MSETVWPVMWISGWILMASGVILAIGYVALGFRRLLHVSVGFFLLGALLLIAAWFWPVWWPFSGLSLGA